jgi:hypothetical protein
LKAPRTYASCDHVPDFNDVVEITTNDGKDTTGVVKSIPQPSIIVLAVEGQPDLFAPAYRVKHVHPAVG